MDYKTSTATPSIHHSASALSRLNQQNMSTVCEHCKQEYAFEANSHESRIMLRVLDVSAVPAKPKQYCLNKADTEAAIFALSEILPKDEVGDARWEKLVKQVGFRRQIGCYDLAQIHRSELEIKKDWIKARQEYAAEHIIRTEDDYPKWLRASPRFTNDSLFSDSSNAWTDLSQS